MNFMESLIPDFVQLSSIKTIPALNFETFLQLHHFLRLKISLFPKIQGLGII